MDCVSSNVAVGTLPEPHRGHGPPADRGRRPRWRESRRDIASSMALQSLVDAIRSSPSGRSFDDPATRDPRSTSSSRARAPTCSTHARRDPRASSRTPNTPAWARRSRRLHRGRRHVHHARRRLARVRAAQRPAVPDHARPHGGAGIREHVAAVRGGPAPDEPRAHARAGQPDRADQSDTHHRDIEDGTRLLLCSDGLTKVASEEDIRACSRENP